MIRFVLLFLISANALTAKPLTSLGCLILEGVVSSETKTWDKPLTFKTVDTKKQELFTKNLTDLAKITPRFSHNQCHHSCTSFAHAQYWDLLAPRLFDSSVSGAYISARVFQEKFLKFIGGGRSVYIATAQQEVMQAVELYGLVTNAQYPSHGNVNTESLADALNKIGRRYKAELKKSLYDAQRHSDLRKEARMVSEDLIQFYFGKFPSEVVWRGKRLSPVEQLDVAIGHGDFTRGMKTATDSYSTFEKVAFFLLKNSIPIRLSYKSSGTHDGAGIYNASTAQDGYLHAAIVIGIAKDQAGKLYYRVRNSHSNAETLYFSKEYMKNNFSGSIFIVPDELIVAYKAVRDSGGNP